MRRVWMPSGWRGWPRLGLRRSGRLCACSAAVTGTREFHQGSTRSEGPSLLKGLQDLEEALSRPSEWDVAFLREHTGDILILGAGGKMGPSLARLCRRAADAAGTVRRVIAVSRKR